MEEEKQISEMSELELEREMKEQKSYNSRYFRLENELEDRDN